MNQHAVTTSGCSFVNSHVCNRAVTCNNEKEFMDVAECIPIAIHVQCVMKVCACCPDRVGNRSGVLGQCHSQGASIHDLHSGIQSSASSCVWTGLRILVFHVRFYLFFVASSEPQYTRLSISEPDYLAWAQMLAVICMKPLAHVRLTSAC